MGSSSFVLFPFWSLRAGGCTVSKRKEGRQKLRVSVLRVPVNLHVCVKHK